MKKAMSLLLVLILMFTLVTGCTSTDEPATTEATTAAAGETTAAMSEDPSFDNVFVNIGTGGTAGTYFPLGGAFAEIWNNNIKGINATAQSTGASVANINLLIDGEVEVVIVQNDTALYAHDGVMMFDGQTFDKLRGLATLYSEPLQIVTTDPSIKTVADLKGKKVAVGAIGSGVEANARQIIAAAGMDFEKDIDPKFLSFAEASSGLKDKQVDAAFLTAGIPTAAIQDLSAQNDVYIVAIEGDIAATLKSNYKFFTDYTIPANTYKGQTEDVSTLTVKSMLCVSADLDEELAYQLTKQIYENLDRVVLAHNVGKYITKETALDAMPIPVHPGAERYFNE
ncbi:TAXI family TRAP transporter solute-binding subunit [Fusibacter bizertensis]|uniref:TAXI family TRAP transporter solute-binding subunit n=1 Tax=Fusibacter bizertensis TaxID=1488331 RepID=A0ABT6ND00_9FIRM|nr:TAXI family TRAP transporter solute-binding subunit [Fusibacter bizertensis]MDH8678276.1 TAXI family TRAP transporter solute-binding subunit [Fusibacter bizertensis]